MPRLWRTPSWRTRSAVLSPASSQRSLRQSRTTRSPRPSFTCATAPSAEPVLFHRGMTQVTRELSCMSICAFNACVTDVCESHKQSRVATIKFTIHETQHGIRGISRSMFLCLVRRMSTWTSSMRCMTTSMSTQFTSAQRYLTPRPRCSSATSRCVAIPAASQSFSRQNFSPPRDQRPVLLATYKPGNVMRDLPGGFLVASVHS